MSVVTLSLVILPEELTEYLDEASILTTDEKKEILDTFKDTERVFFTGQVSKLPNATFSRMTGDDGIKYDVIDFTITSRYIISGEYWIEGDRFRINLTQFTRDLSSSVLGQ